MGDFLHGRGREWLAALETWEDAPWLGAGAGVYFQASLGHQTVARSQFPHDLILELAAELGLLGLVCGLALYTTGFSMIRRARGGPGWWLLAPFVIVFLTSNLVDWTWHLAGLGALWAAAAGALIGTRTEAPAGTVEVARSRRPSLV